MKKFKVFAVLFLLSLCVAAVAAGCGSSSSGNVIDKLPTGSNMPTPVQPPSGDTGDDDDPNVPDGGDTEEPSVTPDKPSAPSDDDGEKAENTVVFVAENFEFSVQYNSGDESVSEPFVPKKFGYTGKWQDYDLKQGGKITVNAEYELINYEIKFVAGETEAVKYYTVLSGEVTAPEIPQKKGYTARWENFEQNYGEPMTVNAIYELIYYKIYFPVKGGNAERTYSVLGWISDEPDVPHKTGFTGEWKYGEPTYGADMYAEAVYTPLPATDDDSFEWALNENADGYVVKEYKGAESEVVIPSTHENMPVTEIAKAAFMFNTVLSGVVISENVTKIGNYAFTGCSNLTTVELPSTLSELCTEAFSNTGITEIELPENLIKIGRKALGNSALTKIVIPDSVTEIEQYAFLSCSGLKSVVIGSGVKTIGEQAFANCTALLSVEIGEGTETISQNAFDGCLLLETAVFRDTTYWYEYAENIETAMTISPVQLENTEWAAHLLRTAAGVFYKRDN